jgi:hypothetical protein
MADVRLVDSKVIDFVVVFNFLGVFQHSAQKVDMAALQVGVAEVADEGDISGCVCDYLVITRVFPTKK